MTKSVIFYLPEGFADWEGSYLMPELRDAKRPFKIVSESGGTVESIGGLNVTVHAGLDSVRAEETEALILIGSDSWANADKNKKVLKMAADFHSRGIVIAGICAATVGLARVGLLDNSKHTSNNLRWMKTAVPNYKGEAKYLPQLAVRDRNLVTAAGIGPVDFSFEVLTALDVYTETKRRQWYELFKHGTQPPDDFWS